MIFPRPIFTVAARGPRAACGCLLGLALAVAACGGTDGSDVDEPEPAASTPPTAPASTSSSVPRGDAAASSVAPARSAGAALPSPPAGAAAQPMAAASPPAAAPSPASQPAAPGAGAGAPPAAAAPASTQLTFAKDIWPIFNSKCGPCHVTQRQGGHNVGSEDLDIALEAAIDREDDILRELRSKGMPPGCSRVGASADGCVSNAQIDEISSWYSEGSPP